MSDGTESQDDRRAILAAALDAANPAAFVERVLRVARTGDETTLTLTVGDRERSYSGRRVVLLAVGKAAAGMAHGAIALLGDAVTGGLVVTTVGGPQPPAGLDLLVAGHPLPDERSVEAARRTGALVDGLGENDLLLILVSGGASALLADLPPSTSLDEYIALTEGLLRSGADIGEINTVRRAAGTLKGGRLALRAVPARVVSLLLSDVVGDDPAVIGSGLTVPSPTDANDAWAVLDQHGMAPPPGIAAFLHAAATHPLYDRPCHGGAPHVLEPSRVGTLVVGGSDAALRGAARRAEELGYTALVVGADLTGDPTAIARMHAQALRAAPHDGLPRAFISGGEAAPIVRGTGRGGPNQECALVLALLLNGMPGWRALVADTDGRDGPTDAAGAMVDGATARAIRAAGLDPAGLLAANDSYTALGAARALLVTGPTGVNVNDLRVVLTRPPSAPRR